MDSRNTLLVSQSSNGTARNKLLRYYWIKYRVTDDIFITKLDNATFTVTSIEEGTGL